MSIGYTFTTPAAMAEHLETRARETEDRASRLFALKQCTRADLSLFNREAAAYRLVAQMLRSTRFTGEP